MRPAEVLRFEKVKPISLRKAKIAYSFGLSKCNRVNGNGYTTMFSCHFTKGNNLCDYLFCFPPEKGSAPKGKKSAPRADVFPIRVDLHRKRKPKKL